MTDSLKLYMEALTFARSNPTAVDILRNYYLQLVTTIFYELMTHKNSPLLTAFCQANVMNFTPKNFLLQPAQGTFNLHTGFDMHVIVYGLNVALAENLGLSRNVYDQRVPMIFRGMPLPGNYTEILLGNLVALDEALIKFSTAEKISVPAPPTQPAEKISAPIDESDAKLLRTLAQARHADDKKILDEIEILQLTLQEELPRLQNALKKISDIRDGLDFATLAEPINQLIQLFDKLDDTLQRHPIPDAQKGYDNLLRLCKNFSRLIERSLAMLGVEFIDETNVPINPDRHDVANTSALVDGATVSKILRVGFVCKGQILRKAEVEVAAPVSEFFGR